MVATNSLFLSYRRAVGFAWARLVWDDVSEHGIDAFLDLESILDAGHFDTKILNQIEARPYFVPVLVTGSLERCIDPDDWFRREIEHAVSTDRAIIPLIVDGFDFEESSRCLPASAHRALRTSNGVPLVADFFTEAMRRLREDRLKPVELPTRTLSTDDLEFAAQARQRAVQATIELPVVLPDVNPHVVGAEDTDAPSGEEPHPEEGAIDPAPKSSVERPPPPSHDGPPGPVDASTVTNKASVRRWLGEHVRAIAVAAVVLFIVLTGIVGAQILREDDASTAPATDPTASTPENDTADETASTSTSTTGSTTAGGEGPGVIRGELVGLGEHVERGRNLVSTVGDHQLGMTDDGALIVTSDGQRWPQQPTLDPQGQLVSGGEYWAIQEDGNLVVYAGPNEPLWSSKTNDPGRDERGERVTLVLEHDPDTDAGVLQIRVDGSAIWTCRPDGCDDDGASGTPTQTAATTETTETETTETETTETTETTGATSVATSAPTTVPPQPGS